MGSSFPVRTKLVRFFSTSPACDVTSSHLYSFNRFGLFLFETCDVIGGRHLRGEEGGVRIIGSENEFWETFVRVMKERQNFKSRNYRNN